jgi:putative phage-type endonuclease
MKIKVSDLTHEEWLKVRNEQGIGASEIGSILGLDPYTPAYKTWCKKSGLDKTIDPANKYTVSGKYFEQFIADIFQSWRPEYTEDEFWAAVDQKEKNRIIQKTNYIFTHDKLPFLFASPDRFVFEKDRGCGCVEIKTTTSWGMREAETEIRMATLCQLQQQLFCTGCKYGYVVIFETDTRKLRVFEFARDQKIVSTVIEAAQDFWNKVLETKKRIADHKDYSDLRPESEGTDAYVNYLKTTTRSEDKKNESTVFGKDEHYLEILEIKKLKEARTELDNQIKSKENKMRDQMLYTDEVVNADTGMKEIQTFHYTFMAFENDPGAKVTWKKTSAGCDYFRIAVK